METVYKHSPTNSNGSAALIHNSPVPTADLEAMGRLSRSGLSAWTKARFEEYEGYVDALKICHNDAAPIHGLPTEILIESHGGRLRDASRYLHRPRLPSVVDSRDGDAWLLGDSPQRLDTHREATGFEARHRGCVGRSFLPRLPRAYSHRDVSPTFSMLWPGVEEIMALHAW
ncbi:hypothetical protein C8Q77DRAFT_47526 [Trametes polyzona]|nr:hypothetical protein C8Q77DRAFT_47526 [Trametes polyzona]